MRAVKRPSSGGGWRAIRYVMGKAREGGYLRTWRAMRSRNTCKTCALGMGGQKGGMVNEAGRFPEVCKKSVQAMVADMQDAIPSGFWSEHSVDDLRRLSSRQLEACGRLVHPMLLGRGATHFAPVSWDDAMERVAERLAATPPDETFWYFSGRSSNEAGFLLQLFARLYGTNNVNNCSYYCHQASGVGLTSALGSGTATITLEDLEHADCVFVIGGNPASNHPRLLTSLKDIRRRGGQVVIINPVRETGMHRFRVPSDPRSLLFGTRIATQSIQPHIGGDLALLTGIAKQVLEMGAVDADFLDAHCEGADEWLASLRAASWGDLCSRAGVDRAQVETIAEVYAASRNCVFAWTMGITHHAHGVQNVQAIANLALMRGMVGREHAGLMPIRGHSNVQGIGSVGVTPKLKDAVFDALQDRFGVELPTTAGLDTLACVEAAHAGGVHLGMCLGGNLYGSNPDSGYADEALARLDTLVYLNTTLNTGHVHGRAGEVLLLPVLARDEEPQPTTQESMFNFVRMSDGGPSRHDGPRSEIQVISDMADAVLGTTGPVAWGELGDTAKIRELIAAVVPGFEAIGDIDRTRREFHINGRTFHDPSFPTPSGKARLHVHDLPEMRGRENGGLRLMTVRSEGQFNTVVYEEEDLYRGQERRDVILMHSQDLERLGLENDEPVVVTGPAGSLPGILARSYDDIREGNALMYYPEANVLLPRTVDPQSRTPAFKGAVVTVTPA